MRKEHTHTREAGKAPKAATRGNERSLLENNNNNMGLWVWFMVEQVLVMHKALGSISSTKKYKSK